MTHPAFIYARYSAAEQGRGTSLKRQFENGMEYAEKRGWLYDPDREISDKGRSAFHGANREPGGELYAFERRVEQGLYRNGAVFVVEHFDRISRQGWEEVHAFLKLCTSNGVSVATVSGDRFYPAGERIDGGTIMELVFKAEGAREESEKKSDRGLKNWSMKMDAIKAGDRRVNIGLTPAWIARDPSTNEMLLNAHRVAVLNEIFEDYTNGVGLPGIVRKLNSRGETSWGYGEKANGAGWNTAYLHKLLTNRAVLGEYEPMARTHSGTKETSKGVRIADYFPQAIAADLYNRAQVARQGRRFLGGPGEARISNLFSGSITCQDCGAPMYFQSQQRAGRATNHKSRMDKRKLSYMAHTDRSYLMCNNNRRQHQCSNNSRLRYERFEPAILDAVLSAVMDDKRFVLDDRVAGLTASVAEAERMIEGKRHNLAGMRAGLKQRFTETLNEVIAETETEIKADEAHVAQLQAELNRATGQGSPAEQIERVREVRASLNSEDAEVRYSARSRVKQALSNLVRIECDAQGIVTVTMLKSAMLWRFDKQANLLESIDHLNEQPVTIERERDYAAEQQRGDEFTPEGKFIPIWKQSGVTVPASDRFVQGFKHDHPGEAATLDHVVARKSEA